MPGTFGMGGWPLSGGIVLGAVERSRLFDVCVEWKVGLDSSGALCPSMHVFDFVAGPRKAGK